jgi:serine/threonine protein kinase
MSPAHKSHPTVAELQAFDSGQLLAAERARIERHLEECVACSEALDALPECAWEALIRAYGDQDGKPGNTAVLGKGTPAAPDIPAELIGHPRYRILEHLGAGGMGVVYKAIHRLMERVVALKVLNRSLTERPGFAERFRREVKAAARLAHPNIVTAYDADEAAGAHFLVTEYVAGTTLDRLVARRGPLPVREACEYIRQAALGLQHAHERGLVHRDIKPHNLLRTPAGQVKILDFGLARVLDETGTGGISSPGAVLGTPEYMAPEQALNARDADIRADIYGLGCTLYHLLAGQPPFPAGTALHKLLAHQECSPPPLATVRGDVPGAMADVLERMLARDPAQRYQTPAHLAADLQRASDPAFTATPPGRRRPSRRALAWAAGALSAVGALALVAYLTLPRASAPPTDTPPSTPQVAEDPLGLAGAEMLAREQRQARDRVVGWVRENVVPQVGGSVTDYVASHIDRDMDGSEAFQVLLGPGITRSSKAALLVGRVGEMQVFELGPLPEDVVSAGCCRVQNYSKGRTAAAPPRASAWTTSTSGKRIICSPSGR